ncbi:unnamed protein product [Ilex paraguariensis]|uniref:Uncharacterized protein n=1 Tax=Ilex paraguariensis TaxID=185542 RepID=A0ABC8RAX6_9AQUA
MRGGIQRTKGTPRHRGIFVHLGVKGFCRAEDTCVDHFDWGDPSAPSTIASADGDGVAEDMWPFLAGNKQMRGGIQRTKGTPRHRGIFVHLGVKGFCRAEDTCVDHFDWGDPSAPSTIASADGDGVAEDMWPFLAGNVTMPRTRVPPDLSFSKNVPSISFCTRTSSDPCNK